MKKYFFFFLLLVFSYQISSQVNFTASLGDADKKIKFHIDGSTVSLTSDTKYLWSFGDGNTSTDKNPIHSYNKAGNYKVCLSVDEKKVCKENVFTVTETGLKVKYVNDIIWPNGNVTKVESPFSFRIKADGKTYDYHRALDIIGEIGDDIHAVADGKVFKSFGSTVIIKHKMDTPMYFHNKVVNFYYSMYLHLDERYAVKGTTVKKGEVIAALGEKGSRGYPHCHLEIRVGSNYSRRLLDRREGAGNSTDNIFYNDDVNVDPQVNPYLFLDNAKNESNSLKYSIIKNGDFVYVKVKSNFLEDTFNEIKIKYGSNTSQTDSITINFNSRKNLPYTIEDDYDFKDKSNKFDIFPIRFKNRKGKDFEITFRFNNISFNTELGDYIEVRDIYGNLGKEVLK